MKEERFIISALVDNHFGVLTRIASLFSRRVFNIDSLTVGETEDPRYSKMTITATGDEYMKKQLYKQLYKQVDVRSVEIMDAESTVARELMLVKIAAPQTRRSDILEAINVFRAKVVDLSVDSVTAEITGEQSKLTGFLEYMRQFGIIDLCRTGVTAIRRGG